MGLILDARSQLFYYYYYYYQSLFILHTHTVSLSCAVLLNRAFSRSVIFGFSPLIADFLD